MEFDDFESLQFLLSSFLRGANSSAKREVEERNRFKVEQLTNLKQPWNFRNIKYFFKFSSASFGLFSSFSYFSQSQNNESSWIAQNSNKLLLNSSKMDPSKSSQSADQADPLKGIERQLIIISSILNEIVSEMRKISEFETVSAMSNSSVYFRAS